MTDDDITRLAEEVGIVFNPRWGDCYTGNVQIAKFAAAVAAFERSRLEQNVASLHMAQSINNQNYPSAWHDGVDAALAVIQEHDHAEKSK